MHDRSLFGLIAPNAAGIYRAGRLTNDRLSRPRAKPPTRPGVESQKALSNL